MAHPHITLNAHSSLRLECAGDGGVRVVYVDPFLMDAEHGMSVAPHDADAVCFTHSHYDHFSPEDAARVACPGTAYVMPAGMVGEAVAAGIPADAITAVAPDDAVRVAGVTVTAVASYNVGKPFHPVQNAWVGYVLPLADGNTVYVCGDTDAVPAVEQTPCSIICIPVGGKYTMDAPEAAALVRRKVAQEGSELRLAIPTHYGSVTGTPADGGTFAALVSGAVDVWVPLG